MNTTDRNSPDLHRNMLDWLIRQGRLWQDPHRWTSLRDAMVRYYHDLGVVVPEKLEEQAGPAAEAERSSRKLLEVASLDPREPGQRAPARGHGGDLRRRHLAAALGFTALPGTYWPLLFLILAGYLTLTQTIKVWLIRNYRIE
jgi:hypothetical protein